MLPATEPVLLESTDADDASATFIEPRRTPLSRAVTTLVTLVLAAMVALPVAQTIARLLHRDIPSAATYTQHLTLWAGFLGAVLATLAGKHLGLSTVHLLPKGRWRLA